MSAIYDKWERLVGAVLKKEQLWQLFHADSVSISSDSSGFSFSPLSSSLDDVPLGWPASSIVVENLSTIENVNSTPLGKRDLKIAVPELRVEGKWGGDAKQQSYPLPLPPNSASRGQDIVESPGSPWKKGKFIGGGLLGGVYIGFNSENGGMCTMKEVPLSSYGDVQQSARMLEKEILKLSHMRHPNIVQYYGSEMVADNFYIYYEYMSRGTIYMILEQYGRLGESVISSYTQQILSGLAYLHSKSIAHRGIKGANILINPKGRVKLTNFGIEKQIAERFHTSWMMDSPYWMAPEVIMNPGVRNLAVDIWSLGCTVLEMATSKPPLSQYDGVMVMSKVAYHKDLPSIPDHLSNVCKDFLRHCLQWNPLHRATASQLLEHPFVKGFSPLGERILVSTSSVANSVKSEGIDEMHARNPHQLDCVKVVSHSCKASTSDFHPRSVLGPISPVGIGSPLLHPRLPQQLSRQTSSPPKSSTPIAATQHTHRNQSTLHQQSFRDFSKQSPNSNSPSYWDPNILRGMFR